MSAPPTRDATVVLVDGATSSGVAALDPGAATWTAVRVADDRSAHLRELAVDAAAGGAARIVVWCGGLDVRAGRPIADVVHHVAEALDAVRADWPAVALVVAATPTGRGRWSGAVATLNGELVRVAGQRGATWLDPRRGRSDVAGRSLPWWTDRSGRVRSGSG